MKEESKNAVSLKGLASVYHINPFHGAHRRGVGWQQILPHTPICPLLP